MPVVKKEELAAKLGQEIGVSDWMEISQERTINSSISMRRRPSRRRSAARLPMAF